MMSHQSIHRNARNYSGNGIDNDLHGSYTWLFEKNNLEMLRDTKHL